ncbi:MAG: outer membrane beta-barrel protein [Planctomycetota bacterium]|jgi:hypothetical protein
MRRLAAVALVCALAAGAGEAAQVSGFIDVSYTWNLDSALGIPNALRLYDDQSDTFTLNAAHVKFSDEFAENASYTLELDVGYNNFVENTGPIWWSESLIQEAYIDAKLGDGGLSLRAGKFEALSGMEGMDSPDNPTVSRGILFSRALPRTYTGAVLGYSDRQFDFGVGMVNGWDTLIETFNNEQSFLATAAVTPSDDFTLRLSYLKGPETANPDLDRSTFDLVLSFKLRARAEIGIEYTSSTEETLGADVEWSGLALQALMTPSDTFSLGARFESFDDPDNARSGLVAAGEYQSFTLAPAVALSDKTALRFELRIDKADYDAFVDSDGNPTDSQKTVAMQLFTTF